MVDPLNVNRRSTENPFPFLYFFHKEGTSKARGGGEGGGGADAPVALPLATGLHPRSHGYGNNHGQLCVRNNVSSFATASSQSFFLFRLEIPPSLSPLSPTTGLPDCVCEVTARPI